MAEPAISFQGVTRRYPQKGAAGEAERAALLARLDAARRAAERLLVIEPAATDAGSAAVLAALRPVDWVVQADPASPEALARVVAGVGTVVLAHGTDSDGRGGQTFYDGFAGTMVTRG